jgi:hypothetical protein
MKYIKSFNIFNINESLYITANEVPKEILDWAKSKIGNTFTKKITVKHEKEVVINMPWHEADRESYQFFKLISPTSAQMVGNSVVRSGLEGDGVITGNEVEGKLTVPSGFVLACTGTYPPRLDLYSADDALKAVSDSSILDDFSIEELIILLQARGLKSPYRTKYPDQNYVKLIEKGYLASNRSITVKGKNIVEMPEVMTKIEDYAKPKGLYLTSSYKLEKDYFNK